MRLKGADFLGREATATRTPGAGKVKVVCRVAVGVGSELSTLIHCALIVIPFPFWLVSFPFFFWFFLFFLFFFRYFVSREKNSDAPRTGRRGLSGTRGAGFHDDGRRWART